LGVGHRSDGSWGEDRRLSDRVTLSHISGRSHPTHNAHSHPTHPTAVVGSAYCPTLLVCLVWSVAVVTVGNGRTRVAHSHNQSLPCVDTKPKSNGSCMRRRLPNLTSICAHGAKPLGAFGLVARRFTNRYQGPGSGLEPRGCGHYQPATSGTTQIDIYSIVDWEHGVG